jgi:predicted dehydrogenase
MAPIRVGLIGLSTSTNSMAPGAWAWSAHLPYLIDSKKYQIVALCNSTKQAAEVSIAYHQLGPNVKAYGSPIDLAMDPDVDLVVISVNILKHYELARPALLAGKDVFVEWPIASSIAEAGELTDLAEAGGVRTLVGLQTRADPLLVKIKELVDGGKIGKLISSTVVGFFTVPVDVWPESASYYIDMTSGGNTFTINFGHCECRLQLS